MWPSKLSHKIMFSLPPLTRGTLSIAMQMMYIPSYLWNSTFSHTNVLYPPLTCGILKLAIKCCSPSPLTRGTLKLAIQCCSPSSSYPWHLSIAMQMLYIRSYLWHSKLSHTNVVYPFLTCGTLTLAIQMLYILLLPVAL